MLKPGGILVVDEWREQLRNVASAACFGPLLCAILLAAGCHVTMFEHNYGVLGPFWAYQGWF